MSQNNLSQTLPSPENGAGQIPLVAEKYINPSRIQAVMKFLDAAAILLSLTALFYLALYFLSKDAAIIAAGFLATEVTYLCMIALRWIRNYDTDFLLKPTHGILAASGVITFVGGAALLLTNTFLFPLVPGSPLAWLGVMAAYFGISRLASNLLVKPLADSGSFSPAHRHRRR